MLVRGSPELCLVQDRFARVYYKYSPAPNDPNVNSRRLAFVGRNATV